MGVFQRAGEMRAKKRGAWQIHTRLSLQMIQFVVYLRDHLLLESFLDVPIINLFVRLFNRDLYLKSAFALRNCALVGLRAARGVPSFAHQRVGLFRLACPAAERVFRLIIRGWHLQLMAPRELDTRSTFALLLTESLRLHGQLVRTAR